MKKSILCLLAIMILVVFSPSCKTTFVWDPSGNWTVNITYLDLSLTYPETFTFSGTDASGTVTGYTVFAEIPPQTGTYAKTGDYSINIHFDFIDPWGWHLIFDFFGTSTEANPNSMTGTGSWYLDGPLYSNLNWTAFKTTNLQ